MRVRAVNVYGEPLPVDHVITSVQLVAGTSKHRKVAKVQAGGAAKFDVGVVHLYQLRVIADGYGTAAVTASGTEAEVAVIVPVSSSAVVGFYWPVPLPEIPGTTWGPEPKWTQDFTDIQRGTVLNIWSKLWATTLGVTPAATFIEEVLEIRDDRIIARVSYELLEAIKLAEEAGTVKVADSSLHTPPDGYINGLSIKTLEEHASLQVSLFIPVQEHMRRENLSAPVLADIDIDEARGIAHAFDVVAHHVTGKTTDPIEIHQLLVLGGVDPGWSPLIA